MATTSEDLKDLREKLAILDAELDRMPQFKMYSDWHLDRVRARESLKRAIARLESEID